MAARCSTFGRHAGTAGLNGWRSPWESCCRISRCRCSSGASSSVGRTPASSGLRRRNRAGKAQSLNGIRPSFQQLVEIKHLKPVNEFEIKLGRKQIKLIPLGAAEEE